MILLYSIFAGTVILGGLLTIIGLIRSGYTDHSDKSALQYTPEETSISPTD